MTICKFSYKGNYIATGCSDGKLIVWDLETRGVTRTLLGHSHAITSLSWSKQGRHLLSTSKDWTAIYWDLFDGSRVHTFRFDCPILAGALNPRDRLSIVLCPLMTPPMVFSIPCNSTGLSITSISFTCPQSPSRTAAQPTPEPAPSTDDHSMEVSTSQLQPSSAVISSTSSSSSCSINLPTAGTPDDSPAVSLQHNHKTYAATSTCPNTSHKFLDLPQDFQITDNHYISAFAFEPRGIKCYLGSTKGFVLCIGGMDTHDFVAEWAVKVAQNSTIRNLRFSRSGRFVVFFLFHFKAVYSYRV